MEMIQHVFEAEIFDGDLKIHDKERFLSVIERFRDDVFEVVLRRKRKHRSNPQNSYYWGVVIQILSDAWGYEKEEVHEILLAEHSREYDNPFAPAKIQRSSEKNTVEFEEYCSRIRRWAAMEFGIMIPEPNEVLDARDVA